MNNSLRAIIIGFLASQALLIFYFLLMLLGRNSFSAALEQLQTLRLWIIPLITTFGIEVGLFSYLKGKQEISAKSTAVSGATSGVAMVACCAHHITDILPLVGLSVFATFLTAYQPWFLALGIISNLIAIVLLLRKLSWSNKEIKQLKTFAILISPFIVILFGYLSIMTTNNISSDNSSQSNKTYQAEENDEKEVAVSVTPESLSSSQDVKFTITMNNHQYELSYNLAKTASLTDNKGNTYKPISWNGSTGGHHVSGQLTFPKLQEGTGSVKLILPDIIGVDRVFDWNL